MSFYLVRLDRDDNDKIVETPLTDHGTFETGAEAARKAKNVASVYGIKVQCRRVAQAVDWRPAVQQKFASGEWRPLPPRWNLEPIADHFAHINDLHPGMVCFIASEADGVIMRETPTTAGRYITNFYEESHGQMDDAERRRLIALIDPSGEIFFAKTMEEITKVYQKGPESCMDGDHDFEDMPCWPTAVYGCGDLAVAYTKNRSGRIQSRALCWPDKQIFGRTYGAEEKMAEALVAIGYKGIRIEKKEGKIINFAGAKLAKVENDDPSDFVMPYFDDILCAIDKGGHFEIAAALPTDQDVRFVMSGGTGGSASLLRYCLKSESGQPAADFVHVNGAEEAQWSEQAAYSYGFKCDKTGKWWTMEHKVRMGTYESWSKEAAAEFGAICAFNGEHYPKDRMVEAKDGSLVYSQNLSHMNRKIERAAIQEGRALEGGSGWQAFYEGSFLKHFDRVSAERDQHIRDQVEIERRYEWPMRSRPRVTIGEAVYDLVNNPDHEPRETIRPAEYLDYAVVGDDRMRRTRIA